MVLDFHNSLLSLFCGGEGPAATWLEVSTFNPHSAFCHRFPPSPPPPASLTLQNPLVNFLYHPWLSMKLQRNVIYIAGKQ
jgi:hypothetical protein